MISEQEVTTAYEEAIKIAEKYAKRREQTGYVDVHELYWYIRARMLYWILTAENNTAAEVMAALEGVSRHSSKDQRLARLSQEVNACTQCRLHAERQAPVLGAGPLWTPVMAITDPLSPGEETHPRPFQKHAFLIERVSPGFSLDHIYITSMLKCAGSNPGPTEYAQCSGYLDTQISIVDPKVIILIGKKAANHLLNPGGRVREISSLMGKNYIHWYGQYPCVMSYHPDSIAKDQKFLHQSEKSLKAAGAILAASGNDIMNLRTGRTPESQFIGSRNAF